MSKKFLKKIIAENVEDLRMISAICSGSKILQSEIKFLRQNRVFLLPLQRKAVEKQIEKNKERINSIIKFDYIYRSKSKNINQNLKNNILELLAIEIFKNNQNFEIVLLFSNNAAITLVAEVIDVTLEDIQKFNDQNNITPKSISTKVKDIMEGARVIKGNIKKKKEDIDKIVDFKIKDDTVENLTETLQKLEDEMFVFAKKMEFEKAAVCRDKINSLKRKLIDL